MYLKIVLLLLTVVNFSLVFSKRPLTANSLWKYSVKVIFKFWEEKKPSAWLVLTMQSLSKF